MARACESRASFTHMFELSWRALLDRMPLVKQSGLARGCGPRALILNRGRRRVFSDGMRRLKNFIWHAYANRVPH